VSSAGYAGTPLARKLGIREGDRVAIAGDPGHAVELLEPLPTGVEVGHALSPAEVVLFFTRERAQLEAHVRALGEAIFPDGACWIAWPKRASKVETDMTEDVIRELALPLGLVDTKVCAVDETWSGLKLVWRKELRAGRGPAPTRTA
jgi:hypothetical protein